MTNRVWIYHGSAVIEEDFNGEQRELDPNTNLTSIRFYSREVASGFLLPFDLITPEHSHDFLASQLVTIVKGAKEYTGNLVSFYSDFVTINDLSEKTKVTIANYDCIRYLKPQLLNPLIKAGTDGFLRYQTSSLTWLCRGDIYLGNKEDSQINIYAIINNTVLGLSPFQKITLVAGSFPLQQESSYVTSLSLLGMNLSSSSSSIAEYMTFPLEIQSLPPGSCYYPLFSLSLGKEKRVYWYLLQDESNNPAQLGYIFTLHQNLPRCQVNVYNPDGMLLGVSELEEKRNGQTIRLILGETSVVTTNTHLTSINTGKANEVNRRKITVASKITNHSKEAVVVVPRYPIGTSMISQLTCTGSSIEHGHVEFTIDLNPNETRVFSCSFFLEN